ncbi:oligopeptidase A [Bacteroidaceae bacterium]|uniref:M3 family metallopeptidase n=1 Tax=Prevotella sp. MGM2 TaxID=2033406 RepID=UPI000CEA58E1|nr:oligopeptidase A [Bacteroidaceae bacterium]
MMNAIELFSGQYDTPHHTFPFNQKISPDAIREGIIEGMRLEDEEINAIITQAETPTFENTIVQFEAAGALLDRATTYLYTMLGLNTDDELEALAQEMAPHLSAHEMRIMHNAVLFKRVKAVYEDFSQERNAEERMLLSKTYEKFESSGATLSKEKADRFSKISEQLSALTLKFSQNVLKETNDFILHLTDEKQLEGLPERVILQAGEAAEERGLSGWVITLHAPSYGPFMTYSKHRDLRCKLYLAQNTKCNHSNEYDNNEVVREIVDLRRKKAQLLGYETYADFVLKRRMAENVETVDGLLHDLLNYFKPKAEVELDEIKALARQLDGKDFQIQPWDYAYYAHLLNKERHGLDSEILRPYFQLEKVIEGVFSLASHLYNITFKLNEEIPVYHSDVKVYDVNDLDGTFLGVLYMDLYPRSNKQGGAWMTNFKEEWDYSDRPHIVVAANLTKPAGDIPSLLSMGEVETLLHEFGHALHGLFAMTRYRSLSGTNVMWDFVELPSQIMENFAVEKEFLRTFACHYKTGEIIPDELIERVVESRNADSGYACLRQVSFGLLDLALYRLQKPMTASVKDFEHHAWKEVVMLPAPPETCMTVQFSHIMSGGYSAGYYSYKWAEVLEADAFSLFKEKGILNQETAHSFRKNILSQGGTRPPMELYKAFRGQLPGIEALLRRSGIPVDPEEIAAFRKNHELDCRYLRMAHIWAENSYCQRRQVGALIVKDKMIISDGYNGTPAGFENICEDTSGLTKSYVLHAEANAITKIARSNNNADGATLYVTDAPCIECSKLIIQSGIKRVVYARPYRLSDGIDLLKRASIEVLFLPYSVESK